MKHSYTIESATLHDAITMAPSMRKADVDELLASAGTDAFTSLSMSLGYAAMAMTGRVDGQIACMFGVGAIDPLNGVGCPWLLGTPLIEKHGHAFLKRSKFYLAQMQELFPVLYNHVDARNAISIAWLKWLGFQFDANTVPYGVQGLPFYRFELRRPSHV